MSDPLATPAEDVAARLDFYLDAAMRGPVGITRDGTMRVVMLSLKDYARLVRRDRQAIRVEDMEGETLDAILNAEPGERCKEAGRRLADPAAT
ncbi:type II toxin-antitoxin system Phd/YefM family antitoxin [Sphingomonas populi]|uniref:Type II toxin-antitoxin system Phd/YefM family antitoxin n=1 Tax=Sphingomonas populi TaxID=2484750 RepID=A0A4Q6XT26_9SPHN|nr:type II toxin-antitoxin system Phd/YefM family antitoxin [Sphingomonas populi]RZF60702.1 type II toxin-antitoxin system Phd/YefM family antitoxin [Sphingomonas populi]